MLPSMFAITVKFHSSILAFILREGSKILVVVVAFELNENPVDLLERNDKIKLILPSIPPQIARLSRTPTHPQIRYRTYVVSIECGGGID